MIYLNGDVIYEADTESDCMFFITTGTVALITFSGKEVSDRHLKVEIIFCLIKECILFIGL